MDSDSPAYSCGDSQTCGGSAAGFRELVLLFACVHVHSVAIVGMSSTRNSAPLDSDTGDEGGGIHDSGVKRSASWQNRRKSLHAKFADELDNAQAMSPEDLRRLRRCVS